MPSSSATPFAKFKNWLKFRNKKLSDQKSLTQPSQVSQKHVHVPHSLQSLPSHPVLPSQHLQAPVSSIQLDPQQPPPSQVPETNSAHRIASSPPTPSHDTMKSVYHGAKMALGIVNDFADPLPPLKTAVKGILKIIEIVEVKVFVSHSIDVKCHTGSNGEQRRA
jgi:hypothetical protein